MPHTTLSAVPTHSPTPRPQPHPRETAFRRHVTECLEQCAGPDAVEQITRLYLADMRALLAQLDATAAEATASATSTRMYWEMLQQVQTAASHGLWERASLAAETSAYKDILATLLGALDRADSDTISTAALRAILSMEPAEAVRLPSALAFFPARDYRAGVFKSHEGDVTLVWTFTGWALVDHGPGALGIIEPTFIVKDKVLTKSSVEADYRVKFEAYLTNAAAPRAA